MAASGAGRRLLPEGRLAGPMPWIIAIMIFLTVLAAGAALALRQSAATIGDAMASRLTVQIVEADAPVRAAAVAAVRARLARLPGVGAIAVVPEGTLVDQLAPWLGEGLTADDIPIPALIDVDLTAQGPAAEATIRSVRQALAEVAPQARVEAHATYLAPVAGLVSTIGWVALAVVLLMAVATGCVVILAARGAHAAHRGTIDIMHLLGATDEQVARLFQRRMMLDAGFGALLGAVAAVAVALLVGRSLALVGGDMAGSLALPVWGWAVLAAVPALFVLIAWLSARLTLRRALRRSL